MAIENPARQIFGLQYHPEVNHTEHGLETITHFLTTIAKVKADWTMDQVLEEQLKKIAEKVSRQANLKGHEGLKGHAVGAAMKHEQDVQKTQSHHGILVQDAVEKV